MARQMLKSRTLEELRNMSEEEFSLLDGIGPERASALVEQFSLQHDYLDELISAVTVIRDGEQSGAGTTVCFTGKMPEKRSYYERLAAENKMIAVDSVTKELSLLVAADPSASGGKLDKARKFNVKIISLDEFLASVGSGGVEDEPDLFSAVQEEKTPEKADPFANGELFSFEE